MCRFVWRKKIEKDVTQGASLDDFSVKNEKKKQVERMVSPVLLRILNIYVSMTRKVHNFLVVGRPCLSLVLDMQEPIVSLIVRFRQNTK